ncbi:unnamed protein product [Adineta ricciae]|uniref:Uncharacterized protein n=1 Tax=Adineta ricciae TaxID=249248 RepID=A0A815LLL1_ADIRI|nr:unnamed protein product [Adineta ricciae]CAF1666201.1 unnamed protein product [Adineta ricciae]
MIKDLNKDKYFDFIVTNSGTNNIGIFFGKKNGRFSDQMMLYTGVNSLPTSIDINHLNDDTYFDIVVYSSTTNYIYVFLVIGDIDNDFYSDIIVGNNQIPNLGIFYGNGNGKFSKQMIFYTNKNFNLHFLITNHFNHDNLLDIAVVNQDYNYIDIVLTKKRLWI